jgi:hypothetical protein
MSERMIGAIVAFVTVIITLVLLALFESHSESYPPLEPSVYDKKLDRLDRRGIEAAYSGRVALLFQNWMTDTNEASHQRALRGHRNARKIYIDAMTALDARDPKGAEK